MNFQVDVMADADSGARPLVTFAIFAFNQERYIGEAVEAAFSQTYSPLEIIISDDCSTDRTFEIIKDMADGYKGPHKVRVMRNQINLGFAGHLNSVLAASNGEIVSWAAGDDIAAPDRTRVFVEKLLESSDNVGVHSNVEEIDLDGRFIRYRLHPSCEANISISEVVTRGQSVVTQSHAFRKSVFDAFGPFRSDLTQEGIAMAFREAAIGKVVFLSECLTKYRIGSGTSTYSGGDFKRRQFDEPIKFTNWYLSAFRQMRDDSLKLSAEVHSNLGPAILSNISFYSSLLEVNTKKRLLVPLVRNFLISPLDFRSIRAAVRVMMPRSAYKILCK